MLFRKKGRMTDTRVNTSYLGMLLLLSLFIAALQLFPGFASLFSGHGVPVSVLCGNFSVCRPRAFSRTDRKSLPQNRTAEKRIDDINFLKFNLLNCSQDVKFQNSLDKRRLIGIKYTCAFFSTESGKDKHKHMKKFSKLLALFLALVTVFTLSAEMLVFADEKNR